MQPTRFCKMRGPSGVVCCGVTLPVRSRVKFQIKILKQGSCCAQKLASDVSTDICVQPTAAVAEQTHLLPRGGSAVGQIVARIDAVGKLMRMLRSLGDLELLWARPLAGAAEASGAHHCREVRLCTIVSARLKCRCRDRFAWSQVLLVDSIRRRATSTTQLTDVQNTIMMILTHLLGQVQGRTQWTCAALLCW